MCCIALHVSDGSQCVMWRSMCCTPRQDPTVDLSLGPSESPSGGAVSYERGTPVNVLYCGRGSGRGRAEKDLAPPENELTRLRASRVRVDRRFSSLHSGRAVQIRRLESRNKPCRTKFLSANRQRLGRYNPVQDYRSVFPKSGPL